MALSLAACGGSDSTTTAVVETPATETPATETPATETPVTETPVTETPTTPVVNAIAMVAGEDVAGTAGADAITGAISSLASAGSFAGTQTIDGGAGADSLSLNVSTAFAGFTTGSMTGVETVNLTNTGATSREFDASGVSGVETYVVDATNGAISFKDVADNASFDLSNQASGSLTIAYDTTAAMVAGTADTLTVSVTNVGTANSAKATLAANTAYVTVTAASQETLDLTSNAPATAAGATNYVDVSGVSAATSVKVSGAAATVVKDVAATVTSFDASSATGGVTATLTSAAAGKLASVKGGAGDDSFTVNTADLMVNSTISGGAGSDTLVIDADASVTLQPVMTGVETLDATDIASSKVVTLSMANTSDLTTIALDNPENVSLSMAGTLKLIGDTGATAITSQGAQAGTITTDTTGAVTHTLTAEDASVTAKSTDASSTAVTGANASAITISSGKYVDVQGTYTFAKATDVSFTSGATAQTAVVIDAAKATTLTMADGAGIVVNASSDFSKVQNLNLTATKTLDASAEAFAAASDVNLIGSGSASAVKTGAIGATDLSYSVDIDVTGGMKGGLTVGNVDAGVESLDINLDGIIGTASIGTVDADKTVSVSAAGALGAVTTGVVSGKDITLDATGALGAVAFYDSTGASNGTASGTADVNVGKSLVYKGQSLAANKSDIATTATSTAVTIDLTGGLEADLFSVTGGAKQTSVTITGDLGAANDKLYVAVGNSDAAGGQTYDLSGLTVAAGDVTTVELAASKSTDTTIKLTGGDDTVVITEDGGYAHDNKIVITDSATGGTDQLFIDTAASDSVAITALSLTNIEEVKIDDTVTVSINASAFSGQSIKLIGGAADDVVTLTGTDNADTIDLSSLDAKHAGNDVTIVVSAGKGADTITLSDTKDTILFADTAANNGADTMKSFDSDVDLVDFNAFLGASVSIAFLEGEGADGDGALAATTQGAESGGTDIEGKILLLDTDDFADIAAVKTALVDSTAADALYLASGKKAVIMLGDVEDGAQDFDVLYVTGAGSDTETITSVGTLTLDDGDALTATSMVA